MATVVSSPTRRVLGDKTPNTKMHMHEFDGAGDGKTRGRAARMATAHKIAITSPRAGMKRRRDESFAGEEQRHMARREERTAEDEDEDMPEMREPEETRRTETQNTDPVPSESQTTKVFSDSEQDHDEPDLPAMYSESRSSSTLLNSTSNPSSFRASQDKSMQEEQFEIPEEMSQRTLEKIHAVKFSQSNPELVPPLRPSLVTGGSGVSQESVGMSSFIDFGEVNEEDDDDDDSLKMIALSPLSTTKPSAVEKDVVEEDEKVNLAEKASTLRTRLQLALFKVNTNQTRTPFARLRNPDSRPTSLELRAFPIPKFTLQPTNSLLSVDPKLIDFPPIATNSPESKIAMVRARMTGIRKPNVRTLQEVGVPVITPGAFSARFIGESGSVEVEVPSSPPAVQDNLRTGNERGEPRTPLNGVERIGMAGVTLTSSVVKGEAASGLLELMRGS